MKLSKLVLILLSRVIAMNEWRVFDGSSSSYTTATSADFTATASQIGTSLVFTIDLSTHDQSNPGTNLFCSDYAACRFNTTNAADSNILFSSTPDVSVTVTLNQMLASGTYTFTFIIDEGDGTTGIDMKVTLTVLPTLSWTSYSSDKEQKYASSPTTALTTVYQYMQTTSYTETIDLSTHSLTKDGYNLQYPAGDIITASVSSTLTASVTFTAGSLTLSITGLNPGCQGTYTMIVTFTGTTTTETESMTINFTITDTCFASVGTTIFMPTFSNVAYTVGTGAASNPSVTIDLSSVASVGTTGCLGIVTTCSAPAVMASSTSYQVSYDATVSTAVTYVVTCTATQTHYGLSNWTTFNIVYTMCSALTFISPLPAIKENLYKSSTLTWSWSEIESLVSNYQPDCKLQLISVTSTIPNTALYTVSGTFPQSSDLTITINLLNQPLSALAAGSYPFTLNLKYLPSTGTTALSAPVTLIDPCTSTGYVFPPSLEILYGSGNTYSLQFPLLDWYSESVGQDVCGPTRMEVRLQYIDSLGNPALKTLSSTTYPQFSAAKFTIAENKTFSVDTNFEVWSWVGPATKTIWQIQTFTLKVVVCNLTQTGLVPSYQIQNPTQSNVKTYTVADLGYAFGYYNHPLCLNPVVTFVNCTATDYTRYPNADPTAFSSSFDQTNQALTINVAANSKQGKYKLEYNVTMQCGTVEAITIEIWVMIQATACSLADGNFIPSTNYDKKKWVRVGQSIIYQFSTIKQKSASSSCNSTTQQLCESNAEPCVQLSSTIFSLANQVLTVNEDSSICNNINDKVCLYTLVIRTYLEDQESIAPVDVYDTFYIWFINCKYAQISYEEPLQVTGLPQTPLLIHPVSGQPKDPVTGLLMPGTAPQIFTFKVTDDVSSQVGSMYCATYNMTITAIYKRGDPSIQVPVTQLDYTVTDKLNLYQTVDFGISDAFWPFYDLLDTDYYTFEFTWFPSPKNRYYALTTNMEYTPMNITGTFDFSVARCIVDNYTVSTTPDQTFTLYVIDILKIQLLLGQQNPNCQHPLERYDVSSLGQIPIAYYNVDYTAGVVTLTITDSELNQPIINTYQPITYRPIFQFVDPTKVNYTTFTVYVENLCKTISLSAAQQIANYVYNITQPAIVIQIPTVRDSASILMKKRNYCGPTFYRILYQDNVSTYPFIWIQETTIYISTASQNYIGTYDFVIQAYIQTYQFNTVNLTFTLEIQQAKVDSAFSVLTPPSFLEEIQSPYTIEWNATLILQLTIQAQPEFTFKIDWESLSLIGHSYTLVDTGLQIMIGPSGESNSTISGQFSMQLSDSNGTTSYTVGVNILGAQAFEKYLQTQLSQNNLTLNASKPSQFNISGQVYTSQQYGVRESKARVSSISRDGLITVSFQPMIDALDNALSFVQQDKLLLVQYIQNNEVNQNFNWTLVAFSRTRLQVQCYFTKPLAVSQGDSPDEIQVSISKSILLNHQPHRLLQTSPTEFQTISAIIPLQARTHEEAVKLEQYSSFVSTAAQTIFWLFIVLQFFARTIIKNLWDVFNYLQILLQLPLFRLKLTVTVLAYCAAVDSIINLKFIPKETIESWFPPDSSNAPESYSAKIIMFVIALSILLVLLVFIMKIRQNSFDLLPKSMQRIFMNLEDKIMFSAVLRTMIQSYLVTSIATVLQLTDFHNRVAWFGAVLVLGYLLGFPYFTFKFQRVFRWKLREPKTRQQFGTIYKDIDVYNLPATCWTMIFLYRRLLFAVIILVDIPVVQVALLSYLQIFTLVYLFRVWPMVDKYSNWITILNEVSIYVLAVLSLAFTDYVGDVDLRMAYGFWFLYIVAVTIGLNVLILLVQYCVNRKRLNALRKSQKQKIMPQKNKVQHKKSNSVQQLLFDSTKEVADKKIRGSSQEEVQQQPPKHFSFNIEASEQGVSRSIHIDEPYIPQMSSFHIEQSHHPIMSIHIDDSFRAQEVSKLSNLISREQNSIQSDHDWAQATRGVPTLKLLKDNSLDYRLNDIEAQLRSPPAYYQKPVQRSPQLLQMHPNQEQPVQQSRPIYDIARPVQRKPAPIVPLQAAREERNPQPSKKAALNDPHQLVSFNQPKITQSTDPKSKPSKYGNVLIQFK